MAASQAALVSPSAHIYERLSDVGSPVDESPRAAYRNAPFGDDSDSDTALQEYFANRRRTPATFLNRIIAFGKRPPTPVQSNYLTLIPLSDDRLKPRHTALLVCCLLLLAVLLAVAVFVAVPRGVTVGTIHVQSSRMMFNTSKSTYQIILTATIPIFNPNYMPAEVSGLLVLSFYDQQAGNTSLQPVPVPARTLPQVISVDMDASSLPKEYVYPLTMQCLTLPESIIFFLTGKLKFKYLGWTFPIPDIDTYFIISCAPKRDPEPPGPVRPTKPPHLPAQPPRPPRPPRPGWLDEGGEEEEEDEGGAKEEEEEEEEHGAGLVIGRRGGGGGGQEGDTVAGRLEGNEWAE